MQGYTIGEYDILFATNVLHATRNMGKTLQQCKALLRKGGLLIANELSAKTDFLTLTFGLTDGWWLFDDAKLRIPGSPIISRCSHTSAYSLDLLTSTAPLYWETIHEKVDRLSLTRDMHLHEPLQDVQGRLESFTVRAGL